MCYSKSISIGLYINLINYRLLNLFNISLLWYSESPPPPNSQPNEKWLWNSGWSQRTTSTTQPRYWGDCYDSHAYSPAFNPYLPLRMSRGCHMTTWLCVAKRRAASGRASRGALQRRPKTFAVAIEEHISSMALKTSTCTNELHQGISVSA